MSGPTCALILIGNELLSGRTQDANLSHIAREMAGVGIRLMEARVIPDIEETIVSTVNELRAKHTYVFTTGGIGPTHDDITTGSVARAFGVPIFRHDGVVEAFHARHGGGVTEAMLKMADFPEGAELIANPVTTAPGFRMENLYVMAGIPEVMRAMLAAILPTLERGSAITSRGLDILMGESRVSQALEAVQNQFPEVDIGSYPFRKGETYGTSLVARGSDAALVAAAFAALENMVKELGAPLLKKEKAS